MNDASVPLVSIVVPLYNHAQYIEFALESFLNEGYPRLEVVILDDGSSDNSYEVAKRWLEKNSGAFENTILEQQENQGITKTLNRLVKLSNGQFIATVASDDALLPGGIIARITALESNPTWLAVFADANLIDENGIILAQSAMQNLYQVNKKALLDDRFRAMELIIRWSACGPTFMARRTAYDSIGWYNENLIFEDRDYYLRLLAQNTLGFIDMPVAFYRSHQNNTIKNTKKRLLQLASLHETAIALADQFSGKNRKALLFTAQRMQLLMEISAAESYKKSIYHIFLFLINFQYYLMRKIHDFRVFFKYRVVS
jgi:glycosyltransferase involved in cell wall biosynthesis